MIAWVATYAGALDLPQAFPPVLWHGHEMVFGFAVAAACGFLLTAVPTWTGTPPIKGGPLAVLVALWLAGRAAFWLAGALPPIMVALADLPLVPVLAFMVSRRIMSTGNRRNYIFPVILGMMFAANLLIHLEALQVTGESAMTGLRLAVYVFVLLLTLISGRVVPSFTANALKTHPEVKPVRSNPLIEKLALVSIIAAAGADLAGLNSAFAGTLAIAASLVLAFRMRHWQSLETLDQPILWVLHLGHAWIPVGFACLGLSRLTGVIGPGTALHAFTAGAFGTMVLAMMTRAALGHTGRPIEAARPIVGAYLLVTLAALLRVFGPPLAPFAGDFPIVVSGLMWAAAYGVFTVVYWPVLTRPSIGGED